MKKLCKQVQINKYNFCIDNANFKEDSVSGGMCLS